MFIVEALKASANIAERHMSRSQFEESTVRDENNDKFCV